MRTFHGVVESMVYSHVWDYYGLEFTRAMSLFVDFGHYLALGLTPDCSSNPVPRGDHLIGNVRSYVAIDTCDENSRALRYRRGRHLATLCRRGSVILGEINKSV